MVIGRVLGPLRAVVPIVAWMMDMTQWKFQAAEIGSATLWLPRLLPGAIAGSGFQDVAIMGEKVLAYVFIGFLALSLVGGLTFWLNGGIKKHRALAPGRQPP